MGCRETIFIHESTIDFPIFLHFLIQSFLFFLFSYFSWASWHCIPCKHSISIVHIFHVILFKAFCKFLRLRNSVWDFWGVNFCLGFLGEFCRKPEGFLWVLMFAPIQSSPSFEVQSISSPGGRESLFTRGACLIFHICMHGLWGGHLFGGGGLLEREFILGNTVIALKVAIWISKSCTWYIETVLSFIPS